MKTEVNSWFDAYIETVNNQYDDVLTFDEMMELRDQAINTKTNFDSLMLLAASLREIYLFGTEVELRATLETIERLTKSPERSSV